MNEIQIFNHDDFGEVRTIRESGTVLFCGNDVARALGYARPKDAVAAHAKGAVVTAMSLWILPQRRGFLSNSHSSQTSKEEIR